MRGRRKKNNISKIQRKDGSWCSSDDDIDKEIACHYANLFTSNNPNDFEEILEGLSTTITNRMNLELTKTVEGKEIK